MIDGGLGALTTGSLLSSLPARAATYLNLRAIVDAVVLSGVISVLLLIFVPDPWRTRSLIALVILVVIGLLIEIPVLNRAVMRTTTYSVDDEYIHIRRGLIVTKDLILPCRQVLNVSIVDGPLLRRCGLVKVKFSSIAAIEALGPLSRREAMRIRTTVTSRAGGDPVAEGQR